MLQRDKHPVNGLVDIFSGRVVDDGAVNVHKSVEIGTTQWLDYEKKLPKQVKTMVASTKQATKLSDNMHRGY